MSVATKNPKPRTGDRPLANADADTVQRVSQAILEAVFTKAGGAPVEQEAFTVRVPKLDQAKRREIRADEQRLHNEIKAQVSPELWNLIFLYGERCRESEIVGELNMMDMMVDALAAHLPGQAPLIRCLANHIIDTDFSMSEECGLIEHRLD